jgi:hypothetical protein
MLLLDMGLLFLAFARAGIDMFENKILGNIALYLLTVILRLGGIGGIRPFLMVFLMSAGLNTTGVLGLASRWLGEGAGRVYALALLL